mgnify:CR=1 FL=1
MNPEEIELMKQYVTYDIESCTLKELEMAEWGEVDEDFDFNTAVKKPFAYSKMLEGVMDHLEKAGGVEFVILKDPELGRWWAAKVKDRERNRKQREAKEKLLSTMSKEELKILGIKV